MATQERWQISYIENDQGIHAMIGEYSVCGSAWDELNGVETMCPIVSCPDCVGIIRNLRRVRTRRPTLREADVAITSCKNCGRPYSEHLGRGKFCKNSPTAYA